MAAEAGVLLAVKPHPAEIDRLFVNRLAQLREELGFVFVNNNTFDLIRRSEKVITINSTVGLETMLCGKPLTCLGNPMYKDFTREDLAFYIQRYLLDIDFFDSQPLSGEQLNAILDRLEL
jgi:capsular polysaccharide export protein